jgi:hypothetical protein
MMAQPSAFLESIGSIAELLVLMTAALLMGYRVWSR